MTELHHSYQPMISDLEDKDQAPAGRAESFSFIVRVWKDSSEAVGDKAAGWRASIEQVGQNQRVYVHHLDSIMAFIEEQTGMWGDNPHSVRALWKGLRRWWTTKMQRHG